MILLDQWFEKPNLIRVNKRDYSILFLMITCRSLTVLEIHILADYLAGHKKLIIMKRRILVRRSKYIKRKISKSITLPILEDVDVH